MRQAATLSFLFLMATSALAAEDTIRRGFNVADGGTLRLDAVPGSVKVVTGGRGVAIEVVRESIGGDVFRDHTVTFEQQGNDVIVRGRWDQQWRKMFSFARVQWNVRVPANYNLDIKTSGGSIDLEGNVGGTVTARTSGGSISTAAISGQTLLKTSGGSIKAGAISGPAELVTSGGSIAIDRVDGELVAHTSGGGIVIGDATGSVNATTSGGSIRAQLSGQPRGDSKLSTSGGGVTVMLNDRIAVDLDARASGGGVHADIPITVSGSQDRDEVKGTINGGGPRLVLRTSGGGIRVKRSL